MKVKVAFAVRHVDSNSGIACIKESVDTSYSNSVVVSACTLL